ncbi:hypothetical protein JTE90_011068 [Oedothorax gibbosus]|uniref:Uncharacterized protein n=1 Tax=Oedothorax gibbosus TaxID=931172 RepID=A0AAV6UL84_9ARAC|nr:hypothetical protein JTE90_011068 [Oedothorax gibbosus]
MLSLSASNSNPSSKTLSSAATNNAMPSDSAPSISPTLPNAAFQCLPSPLFYYPAFLPVLPFFRNLLTVLHFRMVNLIQSPLCSPSMEWCLYYRFGSWYLYISPHFLFLNCQHQLLHLHIFAFTFWFLCH